MSINRRGFLAGIFAATAAPAIVKADNLMKIIAPRRGIIMFSNSMSLQRGNGPIYRLEEGDQIGKEIIVQPRYRFVNHLPIVSAPDVISISFTEKYLY